MKFLVFVVCLFAVSLANARDAKVTWEVPLKCVDGSALSECPVTGYEIQKKEFSNPDGWLILGGVANNTFTRTYTNVKAGDCWRIVAVSNGAKGPPSNEACVDPLAPGAVKLTITVVTTTVE